MEITRISYSKLGGDNVEEFFSNGKKLLDDMKAVQCTIEPGDMTRYVFLIIHLEDEYVIVQRNLNRSCCIVYANIESIDHLHWFDFPVELNPHTLRIIADVFMSLQLGKVYGKWLDYDSGRAKVNVD